MSKAQELGAPLTGRATAVEPVPVSPLRDGIPSAWLSPQLSDVEAEAALTAVGIFEWGPDAEKFQVMFAAAMQTRAIIERANAVGPTPAELRPGRYVGIGNGGFLVQCLDCEQVVEHDWGQSGPAGAATYLRRAHWRMIGQRNTARWLCAVCGLRRAQGMEAAKPPKREAGSARKGDSPVGGHADAPILTPEQITPPTDKGEA